MLRDDDIPSDVCKNTTSSKRKDIKYKFHNISFISVHIEQMKALDWSLMSGIMSGFISSSLKWQRGVPLQYDGK